MSTSLTEANRKAFDAFAETYNAHPWQQRLAKQISTALWARKDWLGPKWSQDDDDRQVRLLDYACGTGAASIALQPFVTEILGMDLSGGMVKKYNEAMAQAGMPSSKAHAIVHDLTDASYTVGGGDLFDVAIISLALHHVDDPELLLKRLAEQIKPRTGILIVLDFLPFEHKHSHHKGPFASMAHTVKKHGFSKEQISDLFHHAGLSDFGFQVEEQPAIMGNDDDQTERHIFIARATRPA